MKILSAMSIMFEEKSRRAESNEALIQVPGATPLSTDNSYHSHPRPELVAIVRDDPGNRVLDLGCGSGAMSALLRKRGKAGEIWGVEKSPEAARKAHDSGAFDKVLEGDLEEVIAELPSEHFNYVIAGDILEHLLDPWTVCEKLNACLVPGGTFICSIPNIRNFSFLFGLTFKKRFEYRDSGVMDRTHLRFFARKDIHDMFVRSGYADIQIGPVRPKKRLTWQIGKALFGDLVIKVFLVTAMKKQ